MKVIKALLVIAVIVLIALMIPVAIDICNGQVTVKQGFTMLILYGLLAIIAALAIEKISTLVTYLKLVNVKQ